MNLLDHPPLRLPAETRPILSPVIHTEEEFDWDRPFDRNATGTTHTRSLHLAQEIFDEFGFRPTYVVDYPIADQAAGAAPLKAFADQGRALIGAHLHPWVSPPYDEEVCPRNSYPGNLPRDLEKKKLTLLTERIAERFGRRPKVYLAGRYGFGPNTAAILESLGYEVDVSPAPPIDFRADTGPDYSGLSNHPYWLNDRRDLLGLPGTGAFLGALHPLGRRAYPLLTHPTLRSARLPGAFSRLHLLERVRLSPEGYTLSEQQRLTRALLKRGIRVFVYSFHSPSVAPGHTPYVRDEADRQRFLDSLRGYLAFFRDRLGGVGMTPLEVREYLTQQSRPPG